MPVIWIARLLGLPLNERVSGSDIFEALKVHKGRTTSVCFFGGPPGAAARACETLNCEQTRLTCVAAIDPGVVTVAQMSNDALLSAVNGSRADLLVVALGSQKGQEWLICNHERITIPIRAHLGAVLNFQAGTVKRAPLALRKFGLEWLWRIKEEPYLWRRYWSDGLTLVQLALFKIVPLAVLNRAVRIRSRLAPLPLAISIKDAAEGPEVYLSGDAIQSYVPAALKSLKVTIKHEFHRLIIDLSQVRAIDQRFLGLLLMVRKVLAGRGAELVLLGISPQLRRMFRLNEAEYLLA